MATDKVNFNIKYGPKTTFSSTSKANGTLYVATNDDNTAELHARLGGKDYQISNGKIDSSLSDTSTNSVQNKIIKEALDKKTSDLNEHTSNKNNPHAVTFAQLDVLKNTNAATADSAYTKATSSSKFYSVQNDKSGKLGVNVPWTDTTYTSLKNPNALIVQKDGVESFSYDGGLVKILNIKNGLNMSISSDTDGNITFNSLDEKVKNEITTSKFYVTGTVNNATGTGTQVFRTDVYVDNSGNFTANKIYNATWNDYAELFPKGEETEPGDIIALDICANEEKYVKAIKGNKALVGVHSNEYGHLIGGDNCSIEENLQKYIPIGLAGRVWVKVHDEPSLGDYITASEIPGVGEVTTIRDNAIGIVVSKKENGKVKIKII